MNKPTRRHYTRNILIRLLVLTIAVIVLMIWQRHFLIDVYFKNQITAAGWVINGAIMALFITGLVRLVNLFQRYASEEADINRFVANLQREIEPTEDIAAKSIIHTRYRMLRDLYARRAPINQGMLASALVATESSYISFPKFVKNILILTGVFGTIVSLSIALIGASDMVGSTTELSGLSTVIHGMSTALSTTMTAILCYLFFGYFYLKLMDTQTHLISRVEQITATALMPRFHIRQETVLQDFGDMVRSATKLVQRMEENQERFSEAAQVLTGLVADTQNRLSNLDKRFQQVSDLLREGFRLPGQKSK